MKTKTLICLIVTGMMIPSVINAQLGGALRNRLNNAINKSIENKADSVAAKNSAENADEQAPERKGINIGGLLGGKVTLPYDDSYSYNNSIYMQAEMYDKKDVIKTDYYLYYSDNTPYFGIEAKIVLEDEGEEQSMLTSTIFDGKNKCILLLTDMGTAKMGIITAVPDENSTETQTAADAGSGSFTKTGNRRVIAGYQCDEYQYKDNESGEYGKVWVTKDLNLRADRRTWSKAGLPAYYGHPALENGVVMATEAYSNKGDLEMKSETKEIKTGINHSMSTAGYTLRQMEFNQAQGQQGK